MYYVIYSVQYIVYPVRHVLGCYMACSTWCIVRVAVQFSVVWYDRYSQSSKCQALDFIVDTWTLNSNMHLRRKASPGCSVL